MSEAAPASEASESVVKDALASLRDQSHKLVKEPNNIDVGIVIHNFYQIMQVGIDRQAGIAGLFDYLAPLYKKRIIGDGEAARLLEQSQKDEAKTKEITEVLLRLGYEVPTPIADVTSTPTPVSVTEAITPPKKSPTAAQAASEPVGETNRSVNITDQDRIASLERILANAENSEERRFLESVINVARFNQQYPEESQVLGDNNLVIQYRDLAQLVIDNAFAANLSSVGPELILNVVPLWGLEKILAKVDALGEAAPKEWQTLLQDCRRYRIISESSFETAQSNYVSYLIRNEWIDKVGIGLEGEEAARSFNEIAAQVVADWKEYDKKYGSGRRGIEETRYFAKRNALLEGLDHTVSFIDLETADPEIVNYLGDSLRDKVFMQVRKAGASAPQGWQEALAKHAAEYQQWKKEGIVKEDYLSRLDRLIAQEKGEAAGQERPPLEESSLRNLREYYLMTRDQNRILTSTTPAEIVDTMRVVLNREEKGRLVDYDSYAKEGFTKTLERKLSDVLGLEGQDSRFAVDNIEEKANSRWRWFNIDDFLSQLRRQGDERSFRESIGLLRQLFAGTSRNFQRRIEDAVNFYQKTGPMDQTAFYRDWYELRREYLAEAGVDLTAFDQINHRMKGADQVWDGLLKGSDPIPQDQLTEVFKERNQARCDYYANLAERNKKIEEFKEGLIKRSGVSILWNGGRVSLSK